MKKHNDYRESIERVSNPVLVLRLDTHKNTEELYIAPESRMRDYLQKETEYIKVTPRRDKKK